MGSPSFLIYIKNDLDYDGNILEKTINDIKGKKIKINL